MANKHSKKPPATLQRKSKSEIGVDNFVQKLSEKPILLKKPVEFVEENEKFIQKLSSFLLFCIYISYKLGFTFAVPFVKYSYKQTTGSDTLYGTGYNDVYIVIYTVIVLLFLRSMFSSVVGGPLSLYLGIKKTDVRKRFSEQLWGMIYATLSFSLGLWLTLHYTNLYGYEKFWTEYPLLKMPFALKFYYLTQTSFWFMMVVYIFVEKPRKDFWIMITHHFVTLSLLIGSYYIKVIAVGTVIHVSMDLVDIFLPLAKILKYIGYEIACNLAFGVMTLSWIASRHCALIRLIYNVWVESGIYTTLKWDPENNFYWSVNVRNFFVLFLISLEVMCMIWLGGIIKIILNVVSGKEINDIRSDSEE
ncbi:hypothetical protein BB559_002246 [Furculomyces boomerangus]|uniref:TLC domain-containing protein n=2 Tax=Harpellales TaxID=61421 RepID=A0A2T9YWX4_9FUNG|nr:hypothetical protein BB559_005022 [Furculomyces boomerangus]PVU96796.1 hypothetical protein BB559_002246 [Furculomyces boomerangus]PVZ98110.1 hypothetical protein BB558_005879 [Smittium angustum]